MIAELHDGTKLEFPDGTDPAVVQSTVKKVLADRRTQAVQAQTEADREKYSPIGSDWENYAAGIGRGATNLFVGGKQRLDEAAAALEGLIPGGAALSRMTGTKSAAQIRDEGQAAINEQRRLDKPLMATKAGIAGDITGSVMAGVPAGALGAAQSGVALGYITPTANDESVLKNTALGGAFGYLGDKVVKGIGRLISPKVAPEAKTLADQGVSMTPGQILGGNFNRAEEKATSVPFLGDAIANARRRSSESLNRAAINRALQPIGESLPKSVSLGRDAIKYTDDALSKAYDDVLPKLTTRADQQFADEVKSLYGLVQGGNMGQAEADQFGKILTSNLSKFQGQSAITGQTLKQMESELGRLGSSYLRDPSADKRQLGTAIIELQSSLRGLVQRTNPQYAKELTAINQGWANFKRVQKAAASVGAEDGIFSAAQLQNAVKTADRSKDKGAFAKGSALMQDLSDPAKKVLGSKVPDSGTPGRLMNVGAMAGLALEPTVPLGLLGSSVLYSQPAMSVAQRALINRPGWAPVAARRVDQLAPYAGLLGASYAPQIGN